VQQARTLSREALVFTYHRKSELKSFVFGLIVLIGLLDMPFLLLLLAYVVKSTVGKGITIFLIGLVVYAVTYMLPSLLWTRHTIMRGKTGDNLIIHFGTTFKGVIPLSNIADVKQAGKIRSKGFGFASYVPEESLLRVTAGDRNLIHIELKEPQRFKISLRRPFFAQKVLINVDEPEAFLEALNQRIPSRGEVSHQAPLQYFQGPRQIPDEIGCISFERVVEEEKTDTSYEWALEAQSLEKYYGSSKAVGGIDLRVKTGEIFGFLGPNGAGKTTTMNMVMGLLRPSGGTVKVFGRDVWKEPLAAKKLLGYVAEHPIVYDRLTGREFVRFSAELYGAPRDGLEDRIDQLLAGFDLADAADDLVRTYSQGMRRKIALAAALVHGPRLLMLDEPTNGVDPKGAWVIKNLLRSLAAQGTTVFMSTHVLEVAENMCDRVAIINKGRIVAEGTVNELKEKSKMPDSNLEEIFLALTASGDAQGKVFASL